MSINASLFRAFRKLATGSTAPSMENVRVVNERPGQHPYPFFLADMHTDEGGMRGRAGRVSAETAVTLAHSLSRTPQYQALTAMLPNEWLDLYFEKLVESRIFPVIRSLCAMEWLVENGQEPKRREIVWNGHRNLGQALSEFWPSSVISLRCGPAISPQERARSISRSVRNTLMGILTKSDTGTASESTAVSGSTDPTVAVHYVEGIDINRRSDLFWFPGSGIDPKRVMIYFDAISRVPKELFTGKSKQLDRMGIRWIQLEDPRSNLRGWSPSSSKWRLLRQWQERQHGNSPANDTERWVAAESVVLLGEIGHWLSFYEEFNVQIHLELNEGSYLTVAQSIATEMHGGIHVGRQRSDSWGPDSLGYHPDHVFFAWNRRGAHCAELNRNRVDTTLISGFPYDHAWSYPVATTEYKAQLTASGANFVVAFFDSAFWWGGGFSRSIVRSFYEAFLRWVIDDPQVGVISKSKRPVIFETLPELEELMTQAVATGRWVNLPDAAGRLPSDASRVADICVGVGISSAVSECVAAGSKGVHCDLRTMRTHPYYQWGYENVVFDDLDRMMAAFKSYKADPASMPQFGDFSGHMDHVDPYADGKSGQRAGAYLGWLLERIDQGNDRQSAMRSANQRFSDKWGEDKVFTATKPMMEV